MGYKNQKQFLIHIQMIQVNKTQNQIQNKTTHKKMKTKQMTQVNRKTTKTQKETQQQITETPNRVYPNLMYN